ncbi:MAG: O-antigen/teichoic acid export membrane protein [Polaribacter sp.]|jgi:O-antigen/teichoic acid export membrane protein
MIKTKLHKLFTWGMLEQLSLNGGNFLFFIIAARVVGPLEFANFSILWVGSQIIISISIPWISLPITSKKIDIGNKNILLSSLKKIGLLSVITPFLLILYRFLMDNKIDWIEVFIIYLLGMSIVFFDALRFFLVRNRAVKASLYCNISKWLIAFGILSFILTETYVKDYIIIILALLLGSIAGLILQFYYSKQYFFKLNNGKTKKDYELDMPLLHLGTSNLVNSIAITVLFTKIDFIVFGVLQAFRSLTNFLPFILQYIESHYASKLINEYKEKFISKKFLLFYFIFCLFCILILYHVGGNLITIIFGDSYSQYENILIFIFSLTCIQSLSRLVNVQNRLQNINIVFHESSFVLWLSSLIYFYLYNFSENLTVASLLLVMLLTSSIQLILYSNKTRSKFNSKTK